MLSYTVQESQNGSLFVVTSAKDNLYALPFQKKDVEEQDFHSDFLQDNIIEVAIAKLTKNASTCIRYVCESCHAIFLKCIRGTYSDKVIYLSVKENSPKSDLIERLIQKNNTPNLVHLKVANVVGQSFYFVFNEEKLSSLEVINYIIAYFKD